MSFSQKLSEITISILLILSFSYFGATYGRYFLVRLGIIPEAIPISGTGSMYPTFPKGEGTESGKLAKQTIARPLMYVFPGGFAFNGKRFFGHTLSRGDIVSFSNTITEKITQKDIGKTTGFVKRVIALPGDTVEIRDGFVWLNGSRQLEKYISTGRSTFGGTFLPDCKKLIIPGGQIFVLGDNRKSSDDSRYSLGLVSISDVDHYMTLDGQKQYSSLWRDASKDELLANLPTLDITTYVDLLNKKRQEYKLPVLKHQSKLDSSASKRASVIIKYDDFSFSATKSGYTMEKAMVDVGYSNIVYGEAPTFGYYSAEELIDNFFQFPQSREFLLKKDFQETGIAVQIGEINNCPVQIVVQQFAGYVPPNYSKEVVASWQKALAELKEALPGWLKIRTVPGFYDSYKLQIDEVVSIMQERIKMISTIAGKMQANQWLTTDEELWIKKDVDLEKRLEVLVKKLNSL